MQQVTGWKESTCYTLMGLKSRHYRIQGGRRYLTWALKKKILIKYDWTCLYPGCGVRNPWGQVPGLAKIEVDHCVTCSTEVPTMRVTYRPFVRRIIRPRALGMRIIENRYEIWFTLGNISKHYWYDAFPTAEAARKLLFLVNRNITRKWTVPVPNWARIRNQLAIRFAGRLPL